MNSNSTQLCRLCLETTSGFVNIFEKFQDSTVASVLVEHFWFQINKDDGMPEWVCEICWSQTKTFHHFYKRLELRHKNHFDSIVVVKVDEIKQERSGSPIEEALEADLLVDKCEEEADIPIKTDDMQTPSMESSCNEDNNDNSGDQSEAEQTTDDEEDPSLDNPSRIRLHNRLKLEKVDAEISRFFAMKCEICSNVQLDTLRKVKKHYREVHNVPKGYVVCCRNKYSSRRAMLEHIQYHANPDAHRCDQCGRSYKDRQTMLKHIKSHARDPASVHKCSLCPKTYTTAAMLRNHMRDKHSTKSEKFPCDHCGKIYPTKYSLTSHIRNLHEFPLGHVCEVCGRTFKSKNDLKYHIELHHSTTPLPKAQCNICGTWLKHKRYLRHHLRMHQETQEAQDGNAKILNCPICKKKVQNKRLLASHIRSAHGERKHQCTFCDKAFKIPKNLKEHIAALHTGVDLYSCTYCDKTFKSNANMYNHRKKAHVAEWTRDKAEKDRCNQLTPNETETAAKMVIDE